MFSQNAEEEHILKYFGDFIGSFLDLGSNDGTTFSNSRALALKGWKGVLVEPSPKAYEKLKALYKGQKGLYPYNVAITSRNGKAMLLESGPLVGKEDVALVSTFHAHEHDRFKATVKYEPVEVKTFTWKTFLNRLVIKQFDFISCDCEGEDLNILKQIDLSNTRAVCVEFNGNKELKAEFDKIMEGFHILYTSPENILYGR